MTTQAESSTNNSVNAVKWVLAIAILIAATWVIVTRQNCCRNYLFGCVLLFLLLWACVLALFLTWITTQGQAFLKLFQEVMG
jgi:hypothetical protein